MDTINLSHIKNPMSLIQNNSLNLLNIQFTDDELYHFIENIKNSMFTNTIYHINTTQNLKDNQIKMLKSIFLNWIQH
jgi:hypothetical protein